MKKKNLKILLLLALIIFPLSSARAMDAKSGDAIYVAKEEIINSNFYAAGNTITIDGTVNGDVIAAGQTININGRVDGDVIAAGQTININGAVGGNIRVIGNSITINNSVSRNVNAAGSNIILGENSQVGWDVLLAGANAEFRGTINGSLNGYIEKTLISGQITKNVTLNSGQKSTNQKLIISPSAKLDGDLSYTSKLPAEISSAASIKGQVNHNTPKTETSNNLAAWFLSRLFSIFGALVVGSVLVLFLGRLVSRIIKTIQEKKFKVILPGMIIMLILPPLALILIFTIIGLPLALIISAWWLVATYIAKILTAILGGQLLIQKVLKKKDLHLFWPMLLGVIISWLLFAIPFAGWLFSLISAWIGLGGLWFYASYQLRNL